MHLVAEAIFRHHGLVPGKDVNLFSAGDNQGRLVALEAGRIDASFGDPPFNIWADKRGYKVLAWAHDYITLPQTSILVTDKKIQQSRDQIKKVIKGYHRRTAIHPATQRGVHRYSCPMVKG